MEKEKFLYLCRELRIFACFTCWYRPWRFCTFSLGNSTPWSWVTFFRDFGIEPRRDANLCGSCSSVWYTPSENAIESQKLFRNSSSPRYILVYILYNHTYPYNIFISARWTLSRKQKKNNKKCIVRYFSFINRRVSSWVNKRWYYKIVSQYKLGMDRTWVNNISCRIIKGHNNSFSGCYSFDHSTFQFKCLFW